MYTSDINTEALEKANQALAIIEQFETICDQLDELTETVALKDKASVVAIAARARALLKVIDESDSEAVLALVNEDTKLSQLTTSKIEKLGISGELIRMRLENKMPIETIARKYHLSNETVMRFLKIYDRSTPLEKAKIRSRSIMDYINNWEEIGAMIYRMLHRLENDPEHHVKYLAELRQLTKDIEKFQSRHTAQQQIEQIKATLTEILIDIVPEKRALIRERLGLVGIGRYITQAE